MHGLLAGVRSMHIHDTVRVGETFTVDCRLVRRMGNLIMVEATGRKGDRNIAHGILQIGLRRTE